jgi:DNA-binding transcriptional ArsR family regulator
MPKSPGVAPICDVFALNEKSLARVRGKAIESAHVQDLAGLFRLLGNPTRVRILDALGYSELCVCDLAALLEARISAVSHQLALLKRHHLVKNRREGKMVFYSLDDLHVRTLVAQGLAHTRHAKRARGNRPKSGRALSLRARKRGAA